MPTSGAVYQPTTVTYEQQPNEQRWSCPMSYFSRRLTNGINRTTCWQIGLLVFGVLAFITGLILVITGSVQYSDGPSTTPGTSQSDSMGLIIAGAIIMALGLLQTGVFAWVVLRGGWARGKDAGAGGGAAALTALNPSTDPLVAAQYAPVRDAPPAPDDERRNLMDNKDCLSSAEESDKMLEGRPTVA